MNSAWFRVGVLPGVWLPFFPEVSSPKSPAGAVAPGGAHGGAGRWNQSSVWKALQVSKSMNSKWTQQDLLYAIELVRQGMPIKPAAEKCNIPVMTLWRRTRALGVFSSRAASGYRPAADSLAAELEPLVAEALVAEPLVAKPLVAEPLAAPLAAPDSEGAGPAVGVRPGVDRPGEDY